MFKYKGKKYKLVKVELIEKVNGLKAKAEGYTCICINNKLSKIEQQKVLHDILKDRKLSIIKG